jgi:hypothetical protein
VTKVDDDHSPKRKRVKYSLSHEKSAEFIKNRKQEIPNGPTSIMEFFVFEELLNISTREEMPNTPEWLTNAFNTISS